MRLSLKCAGRRILSSRRVGKRFYRLPTRLLINRWRVGTHYVPTLLASR